MPTDREKVIAAMGGRLTSNDDAIIDRVTKVVTDARAEERKAAVALATLVVQESVDCDECDEVALWCRQDDPETYWDACDKHKGDDPHGWVERKALRAALTALEAAKEGDKS